MEVVERLQAIEGWVAWLRAELDREVSDLIAVVVSRPQAPTDGVASWVSFALAVRAGQQLIAERISPLLAGLDEVVRQLQFAQAEAAGVSR